MNEQGRTYHARFRATLESGDAMHILEADKARIIDGLKCTDEGDTYRLTFRWPEAVRQVYIYKKQGSFDDSEKSLQPLVYAGEMPGGTASCSMRLHTLQEYRMHGGYTDAKTPGTYTYHIYPFERVNGEDIYYTGPDSRHIITVTGQGVINCSITERQHWRDYKLYDITITSGLPIPPETVCCVKKEGAYPVSHDDGVVYYFYEPVQRGELFTRHMQVGKDEYVRLFIAESAAAAYRLDMAPTKTTSPGYNPHE